MLVQKLRLALLVLGILLLSVGQAGVLTKTDLVARFPSPYIVADRDAELPVWPIFKQNATENELVGYVFETIDMAPIPGFGGVPINLLIALDPKGSFIDVKVLSQHEPVFVDGLGEAPLFQFVSQYQHLSINQNIKIGSHLDRSAGNHDAHAIIDGVSKATASIRIINQSILAASLKVARKKLGFAQTRDPDLIATIKAEPVERHSIQDLLSSGLVQHLVVKNKEVEQLFSGTGGAELDSIALQQPDAVFIDLYLAYVSIPSIGSNLLREESWQRLGKRLDIGDHALLLMSAGRYHLPGDNFVRGSVPDRLLLKQDDLPIEMRDLDMDLKLAPNPVFSSELANSLTAFRIIRQAGLDPSQPLTIELPITRSKGIIYPEKFTQSLHIPVTVPARFYNAAESDGKSWQGIWHARRVDLAILLTGLTLLTIALIRLPLLTRNAATFVWIRRGFLLYTLFFIGWIAQGQLSIVNITGLLQALLAHRSLAFFLYDPMTVVLWAYTALALLIWGRGTFCGWLCPFGALQEFTGKIAAALHLPQLKLHTKTDARLKWLKYVLLAAILLSVFVAPDRSDALIEIEPFKTAITLNFVRSWPYQLYAVGLLLVSSFSYKFFCRYLCPFGASLAVLGYLRIFNWIPRRKECGTPCQSCRHKCEYQAIEPSGAIDYQECFQCLDCVVIYASEDLCAPLLLDKKRRTVIPISTS